MLASFSCYYIYLDAHIEVNCLFYFILSSFSTQLRISIYQVLSIVFFSVFGKSWVFFLLVNCEL